ncbi:hypothetical protein, partial [Obesumbacterium proteus]|uniref:hypothetical protein n=1 Tax=Obesumbacterium proteus TaxID=82983 RepID=UPI0024305B61
TKDKRQKTKDKRQKTKDKRQKTKDKRQKTKPYLVSCLSLGSESSGNRMFPLGEEAPGMAHADPARRWRLG